VYPQRALAIEAILVLIKGHSSIVFFLSFFETLGNIRKIFILKFASIKGVLQLIA
jgi:hypothetical protein